MFYLSQYMMSGTLVNGSLLDRVVRSGHSPVNIVFNPPRFIRNVQYNDGHIDSLKMLLQCDSFIKPYSDEHMLVHLLTTAL